jgi:hypothetical protein
VITISKKKLFTQYDSKSATWKNKWGGNSNNSSSHDTKAEAIKAGRDMAKKKSAEHVIKNMDGKISNSNSYGNDPHPPIDKKK